MNEDPIDAWIERHEKAGVLRKMTAIQKHMFKDSTEKVCICTGIGQEEYLACLSRLFFIRVGGDN